MQPKIVQLEFAELKLFDNYAISTIKEGVMFKQLHLDIFFEIFAAHFGDTPFISIANRKNDYTVDPHLFRAMEFPGIVGIGVVCYTYSSYQITQFEREFYPGLFKIFREMDECLEWVNEVISKN